MEKKEKCRFLLCLKIKRRREFVSASTVLHTGDLRLPLLLLEASFLQVRHGGGESSSKHREAADASSCGSEVVWRGGGANRPAR